MSVTYKNEAEVANALAAKYAAPEWALLRGVRNGTGANHRREADAIAMNLFPSRGLEIWGFEIKVSRTDLQKELKQPEKADVIAQFCDKWWLALGDRELLKDTDEIPQPWGILAPRGSQLAVVKKAEPLPDVADRQFGGPQRGFLAALLRRVFEQQSIDGKIDSAVKAAVSQAREETRKTEREFQKIREGRLEKRLDDLLERVHAFREATGIDLTWRPTSPKLFKLALELIQTDGLRNLVNTMARYARTAESNATDIVGVCDQAIRELNAAMKVGDAE